MCFKTIINNLLRKIPLGLLCCRIPIFTSDWLHPPCLGRLGRHRLRELTLRERQTNYLSLTQVQLTSYLRVAPHYFANSDLTEAHHPLLQSRPLLPFSHLLEVPILRRMEEAGEQFELPSLACC